MKPDILKAFLESAGRNAPIRVISAAGVFMLIAIVSMALKIDRARSDFYTVRKQLDLYRSEVWQLDRMNEPAANQELKEELAKFSLGRNAASLIEVVSTAGKKFDISFTSISPKEKTELPPEEKAALPDLARIPIGMNIRGSYENIALFLSELSKLDRAVIRVNEFRLAKLDPTGKLLGGSLTVSAYVPKEDGQPVYSTGINLPIELRNMGRSRFREFGRNPFVPWAEKPTTAGLILEGILYDEFQPVVLIDGKIWRLGDQVKGVKILEIKPTSIVIERNGKQETVRLRTG